MCRLLGRGVASWSRQSPAAAAVLASSLLCVLVLVAPAQAAFSGKNGKIAYTCDAHICVANPDGSGAATLAPGTTPVWSPDGTGIAFIGLDSKIYLMNADGTGLTGVNDLPPPWATNYFASRPDISSKGYVHVNSTVRFVSPDGALQTRWGETETVCRPGRCSSSTPLYVETTDGTERWVIGAAQVRGWHGNDDYESVVPSDWSPDSRRIVARRVVGTCGDGCPSWWHESVQIITPGGPSVTVRPLTQLPYGPHPSVTWSPDGTKLLHGLGTPVTPSPDVISVINLDDLSETVLPLTGMDPVWQPLPGPQRSDFKNAAKFCKAEQDFWGDQFASRYGGGKNAFGKCVNAR